eukprot:6455092-Amphidinium_carterae.1
MPDGVVPKGKGKGNSKSKPTPVTAPPGVASMAKTSATVTMALRAASNGSMQRAGAVEVSTSVEGAFSRTLLVSALRARQPLQHEPLVLLLIMLNDPLISLRCSSSASHP